MSRIALLPLRMRARPHTALLGGFEVPTAAVGAQPVQGDHVHGDDGQGPERVGGDEEHLVDGVEPDHHHGEPAGRLVACQHAGGGQQLQGAEDEGDPAPGALVGEHVVGVGGEHVGVGDRGDALDHVEAADDQQQDGREQDQAITVALGVAPGLADGWCSGWRHHGGLLCRNRWNLGFKSLSHLRHHDPSRGAQRHRPNGVKGMGQLFTGWRRAETPWPGDHLAG